MARPGMLAADGRRIRAWARAGLDVYVYFNNDLNDLQGFAIDNAERLRQLVERNAVM